MNIWLHKHTRPLLWTPHCLPPVDAKDLNAGFLQHTSLEFPAYVDSMSNCQMLASTICHQIISFSSHRPTGIWTWNTLRRIFSSLLSLTQRQPARQDTGSAHTPTERKRPGLCPPGLTSQHSVLSPGPYQPTFAYHDAIWRSCSTPRFS